MLVRIGLLAALLLQASPASAETFRDRLIRIGAATSLDVVTTEIALSRGAREIHPLMQGGTASRIAINAGVTVGTAWLAGKVEKRHPRLAKWGVRAVTFGYYGVSANNAMVAILQEQPR